MDDELLNLYLALVKQAEALQMDLLEMLRRIAERKLDNPFARIDYNAIGQAVGQEIEEFKQQVDDWKYESLVAAYLIGITAVNNDIVEFGISIDENPIDLRKQMFFPDGNPKPLPQNVLEEWQQHRDAFSILSESTSQQFDKMRTTVVRDVRDKVRRIAVEATKETLQEADTITQRKLMNKLLKDFADEGITAVRYKNGAKMGLRVYTQMVSRTMVNNAARQGALNRQMQIGHDLVRMSVHFPTCSYCAPFQGGIYSISGNSEKYRPLSVTRQGGAFHPSCTHSVAPYYVGISPGELPAEDFGVPNERMYKLQARQRTMESYVRKWKRRETVSLDPSEQAYIGQKIDFWRGQLRELTNEHEFLKYQGYRTQLDEIETGVGV